MAHISIKEKSHRGKIYWRLYCEMCLTMDLDTEKEAQELAVLLLEDEKKLNLKYVITAEQSRTTSAQ